MSRSTFGSIRKLRSKRWQARYTGPDGRSYTARTESGRPLTFDGPGYARRYLERVSADIQRGTWQPPEPTASAEAVAAPLTLRQYAETWLASRRTASGQPLSPSTRRVYRQILASHILPGLGALELAAITPAVVRAWYAQLATGPRQQAAAYSLLSTICATAAADEAIQANPCRIRHAGVWQRQRDIRPATLAELAAIAEAMPARYRLIVLLAGWLGLRFGELAELRRGDVDLAGGVVYVRRGVVRGDGGSVVKDPKTRAGKRMVHVPPHLLPAVGDHLDRHVQPGARALLFTGRAGGQLANSSLHHVYNPAAAAAGRPDLSFHGLRHTHAQLAAATGATLAELMARLGHSTVSMAMRYQHAAEGRDLAIAEALSQLATVTPISAAKGKRQASRTPESRQGNA